MKRGKHQDVFTERVPGKTASEAKQLRKLAGDWLKQRRADAELSQADLAARLGLKYYTFISQVENGFSRVPTEIMGAWAGELGLEQATFARHLLVCGPERFSREARAGARRDRGPAGAAARGFRLIAKSL